MSGTSGTMLCEVLLCMLLERPRDDLVKWDTRSMLNAINFDRSI